MQRAETPRRGRATFWLILLAAVAPVAASYFTYLVWQPQRTVNYGELIPPHRLPDVAATLADGTPFRLSALKGKWVLVAVGAANCDAACDRKLVYMRQLRLTQGKNMDRIERAWLVSDGVTPSTETLGRYPGTHVLRVAGTGLAEAFPAPHAASDHIYVIDPLGNLMMRFPRDPDPKRMIQDIARLLKASRIG